MLLVLALLRCRIFATLFLLDQWEILCDLYVKYGEITTIGVWTVFWKVVFSFRKKSDIDSNSIFKSFSQQS